ncbi:hypothetical protein EPUS_06091 [Endocarpon pusillum Z07020]|uniref:AB hydrolase-1 domain-containing protein n=1 Tax=Endocarpon pusillum (strain Z07020 / HMAS-L-300199) TaxID=1263415 RepID=U1HPL3_ENDPU|nr:uncharacterized protein EPUS_06091 [Endocarpon pusillum Z07020]ERF72335.1 hypothetical protein EPUS_06091 [Endocarpon pusillum Z07020]
MTKADPTTLFMHGAWYSPNHFQPIMLLFGHAGYPTDAKDIHGELEMLVEQVGQEVVVVTHSYGGMVGTETIHERASVKDQISTGV